MAKTTGRGTGGGSEPTLITLSNGLRVVLQPASFAPVVSISVWVNVGSADETPAEAGLAHLHEHMVFKGTARRGVGQIAAEIEGAGGEINAFTSYDQTCYYVNLGKDELALGLDVLGDAVGAAAFDAGELEKEIRVILEEINLYRDLPQHYVSESCWRQAFQVHPYGRPILGAPEVLKNLKRRDVFEFYRKHYKPANAVLAIAGDFEPTAVKKRIEQYFGEWKRGSVKLAERPAEPPQAGFRGLVLHDPIQLSHLYLAWRAMRWNDPFAAELDLLALILSHGDSSRLEHRVKSIKRLVHDVSAHVFAAIDPGVFGIDASTNPELMKPALAAIFREVYRLRTEPVQEEEFSRARRNLEASFLTKHETASGLGHSLGYSVALTGDVHLERDYLARVMAATRQSLRQAAQKFLTHQNLTASVLLPPGFAFSVPELEQLAREAYLTPFPAGAIGARSQPPAMPALVGEAGHKGRLKRVVLPNGVRIVAQESSHAPLFALRVLLQGGLRYEPAGKTGLAHLTAQMLARGTETKSAITFAKIVEGLAGSVRGFVGYNSCGVSAEFLSRDFDQALDLTSECVLQPAFRNLEIKRKKDEIVGLIREHNDNPSLVARDLLMRELYGEHPYARTLMGTEESLGTMLPEELAAHWRSLLDPRNVVIALAGDVEFERAVERLKTLFGGLKPGKFKTAKHLDPALPAGVLQVSATRKKEQTHILLGLLGCRIGSPDEYALHLLNATLSGQGGRLFVELRDKLHLAYNVHSFFREGVERGTFGVYIATSTANADQAVAATLDHLRQVVQRPPRGKELARAKRYLIGSQQLDLQTAGSLSLTIGLNELLGVGYRAHQQLAEKIRRITDAQMATIVRRYLTLDRMVIARVGEK